MDVREKLVQLVKNALRAYGKDLEKIVEPYEFIADFLIHSGVTVQEWISVKDRLPEEKGRYLIANNRFGDEIVLFDLWSGGGFWYVHIAVVLNNLCKHPIVFFVVRKPILNRNPLLHRYATMN